MTRDALPSKRIAGALVQHFPWCAKWSLVSITVSGEDDTEVELDPEECLALRAFLDDALRMHAEAERADAAERMGRETGASAMDDTNVGPGMVNHRKHCQCLECAYQNVLAERDGLLSARDDLGRSNARLVAELGDAKQSIIDLTGANTRYEQEVQLLRAEVRAAQLLREGMTTLCNETERLLRLVVEDYNDNVGQVRKEVRDFLANLGDAPRVTVQPAATLVCPHCEADRAKEPCPWQNTRGCRWGGVANQTEVG